MSKSKKSIEDRISQLESSQDTFAGLGKNFLILGIFLFIISFMIDDFFGLFSLRTVAITIAAIGLIMKVTLKKAGAEPEPAKKSTESHRYDSKYDDGPTIVEEEKEKPRKRNDDRRSPDLFESIQKIMAQYMPKREKRKEDLETNIATKWFTRIGAVSLVIGIIFFLKYAFDRNLIPPAWRIAIGVSAALLLISLGEYFDKKKYILFARGLTGAGFAVLYASVYAAHNFYDLIPLFADLVILIVVVILGVFFAIRYDSIVIASLAFFLGYFAAYLTGNSNIHTLGYSTLLTVGLLILVYKKGWKYLGIGGLIATYIIHMIWLHGHPEYHLTHLIFLTIYLVIFGIMAIRLKDYAGFKRQEELTFTTKILISGLFLISFGLAFFMDGQNIYYLAYYSLLSLSVATLMFRYVWGEIAAGGAIATYVSFVFWHEQNKQDPNVLIYSAIFLTIYFLLYTVLSFFLAKDQKKITMSGNIIMILINSFAYYGLAYQEFQRSFEQYTGLFTLSISIFYLIAAYASFKMKARSLFITYLTLAVTFLTLTIPIQLNNQWITISWAVEALVLIILGLRFNNLSLRILGYIVAIIAAGKTAFKDAFTLQSFDWHNLIGSTRAYVFVVTIIALYIATWQLYRQRKVLYEEEMLAATAISIAATSLTTWILYLEGNQWSSLLWAVEALVLIILGLRFNKLSLRISGYIVASIAAIKTAFKDAFVLQSFDWHNLIGSTRAYVFVVTIIALYIATWQLYRQRKILYKQEMMAVGSLGIAATALTTWILYLEGNQWSTLLWTIQALAITIVGIKFKKKEICYAANVIGVLIVGKLVTIDRTLQAFSMGDWQHSLRVFMYGTVIVAFYIIARLYEIKENKSKQAKIEILAYDVTASILTTIVLALEFDREWTSVAWAIQAIILLIIGVGLKRRIFRQLGISIFGITIGKVFLIDFQKLEMLFRIISFIGLGVLLLVAAYIYHRYKDRIKGFI